MSSASASDLQARERVAKLRRSVGCERAVERLPFEWRRDDERPAGGNASTDDWQDGRMIREVSDELTQCRDRGVGVACWNVDVEASPGPAEQRVFRGQFRTDLIMRPGVPAESSKLDRLTVQNPLTRDSQKT